MAEFVHEIDVAADTEHVRRLITRHGDQWWTTNAVISDREGGACEFQFPSAGFFAAVRVMTNTADLIEWRCVGSAQSPSAMKASVGTEVHEWVGSLIRFILTASGPKTTHLRLEHQGLGSLANYYSTQNNVWAFYLGSLKRLAETGKGEPFQGGRPGTQTEGLVALAVTFKVVADKIGTATEAIATFIANIEKNEPDTLVYRSYRDAAEPNSFVHYMMFRDADAHHRHRNSAYCAAFVKVLYPCCESTPRATALSLFGEAALGAGAGRATV